MQVGVFTASGVGSNGRVTVYVSPQYGDVMSHVHRTYRLAAKPCGTPVSVGGDSGEFGRVRVSGYSPDCVRVGSRTLLSEEVAPLLKVGGEWTGRQSVAVRYSISLQASQIDTSAPSSFPCRLAWESDEGNSGLLEVPGFFVEVPLDNGMTVSVEPGDPSSLSTLVKTSSGAEDLCKWTLDAPACGTGWAQNSVYAETEVSGGRLAVYGNPSTKSSTASVLFPAKLYRLPEENPSVGDILKVDGVNESVSYQFIDVDTDVSTMDQSVVPVLLSGSSYDTYAKIAGPARLTSGAEIPCTAIVVDKSTGRVFCGAKFASLSDPTNPVEDIAVNASTVISAGEGASICAMVFDESGNSLVDGGYVAVSTASSAVGLSNGMSLSFLPYAGLSATVDPGTQFDFDIDSGANGAAYRYCIGFDQALSKAFPPVPARSGTLVFNGIEMESDALFGDRATYSVGGDSIYWFNDLAAWTPWPMSWSEASDTLPENENRLMFHFVTAPVSGTGPVTSLRPAEGSPIRVLQCGTSSPSTVGDLALDVDLTMDVGDGDASGYKAVKTSRNGRLVLGPLVEKIVAGPGISVMSGYGQPYGQGAVTISATNSTYSGEMDTIALENAKEEMVGMFPYIRLLGWSDGQKNIDTGFVAKFHVPIGIPDGVYRIRVYATVFGETSFANESSAKNAGLSMTYSILPEWKPVSGSHARASFNLKGDRIEPDSARDVDIPFGVASDSSESDYSYTAFDPVMVHNDSSIDDEAGVSYRSFGDSFPNEEECSGYLANHVLATSTFGVRPGNVVAIRFSRKAPSSGSPYEGRLGFMNLRWELVAAGSAIDEDSKALSGSSGVHGRAVEEMASRLSSFANSVDASRTRVVDEIRAVLLNLIYAIR